MLGEVVAWDGRSYPTQPALRLLTSLAPPANSSKIRRHGPPFPPHTHMHIPPTPALTLTPLFPPRCRLISPAVAEAAVGRDAVMRAVASAVLQADALEHALLAALPLGPQGAAGGVSLPDLFQGELQVGHRCCRHCVMPLWHAEAVTWRSALAKTFCLMCCARLPCPWPVVGAARCRLPSPASGAPITHITPEGCAQRACL